MDGPGMELVLPILGIAVAATTAFYAVSFSELREKSLRNLDEQDDGDIGFRYSGSRQRRAQRKAAKQSKD